MLELSYNTSGYGASRVPLGRICLIDHLRRQTNATLLQNYGSNAFRIQNYLLEATTKQVETISENLKQATVDVNRERKNDQASPF
jgi:Breast carcinoma amplified sequence 2 (BCAS2)